MIIADVPEPGLVTASLAEKRGYTDIDRLFPFAKKYNLYVNGPAHEKLTLMQSANALATLRQYSMSPEAMLLAHPNKGHR